MTVPFLMPLVAAREARRLHMRNPETYTVAMLARRFVHPATWASWPLLRAPDAPAGLFEAAA
jgi:hypothetical protein